MRMRTIKTLTITAIAALMVSAFATGAGALEPMGKHKPKPDKAMAAYRHAVNDLQDAMDHYRAGNMQSTADFNQARDAWKAANDAQSAARKAIMDTFIAAINSAITTRDAAIAPQKAILDSASSTDAEKAAATEAIAVAKATFRTAKRAAEDAKRAALQALAPLGAPPARPMKSMGHGPGMGDKGGKKGKN